MTAAETALLLARIQFGFTVSFHFIFPSFSIGLASYLMVLEGLWLHTGKPVYLDLFRFWVKIFAVAFATHQPRYAFLAGLATAIGAGVSMAFSEGLSDTGDLTGRGRSYLRGAITGAGPVGDGVAGGDASGRFAECEPEAFACRRTSAAAALSSGLS